MRDPIESSENQYLNEMYGDEEAEETDDTVEIDRSYIAKAERAAANAPTVIVSPVGECEEICKLRGENAKLMARLKKASEFTVQDFGRWGSKIIVRRQEQGSGDVLWSVNCGIFALEWLTGKWSSEPSPSNRDDKYLKNHRYATLDEAWEAAEGAKCPYALR